MNFKQCIIGINLNLNAKQLRCLFFCRLLFDLTAKTTDGGFILYEATHCFKPCCHKTKNHLTVLQSNLWLCVAENTKRQQFHRKAVKDLIQKQRNRRCRRPMMLSLGYTIITKENKGTFEFKLSKPRIDDFNFFNYSNTLIIKAL